MAHNYIATVRSTQVTENGQSKTISQQVFIKNAVNFTDAEAKAFSAMDGDTDLDVTAIKRTNIVEVVLSSDRYTSADERLYKVKLNFYAIDMKSGKEKKHAEYYLVVAQDINIARKNIIDHLQDCMVDYKIATIDEVKITHIID